MRTFFLTLVFFTASALADVAPTLAQHDHDEVSPCAAKTDTATLAKLNIALVRVRVLTDQLVVSESKRTGEKPSAIRARIEQENP